MTYLPPWRPPEKIRPSWWTPDKVLEILQSGTETASDLCRRASDECGGAVSPKQLRADISKWANSLTYGEQMTAAVALWRRNNNGSGELILSSDWHDDYLAHLEAADGDVERAAEDACIGVHLVYARIEPTSRYYDAEFADRVKLLEGKRYAALRSNVFARAEEPTIKGATLAARVLSTAMPGTHGERRRVEVEAQVAVEHTLSADVIAASAARTRALLGNRGGATADSRSGATTRVALPPPPVTIDLPAVRVIEEVDE